MKENLNSIFDYKNKIYVLDDWLDHELATYLSDMLTYKTPHLYCQTVNNFVDSGSKLSADNYVFYYNKFEKEKNKDNNLVYFKNEIINFLSEKIKNFFKFEIETTRCYLNVQHAFQDGSWHQDDEDITILWMASNTLNEQGHFEYLKNDIVEKIPFVFNRIIIFDSSIKHRGMSSLHAEPRVTLAFKNKIT